ncbi:MAG: hypothetical protein HY560_03025, partial [Gemmatimonadetes bacterium]|nr:hypothetical protein [Gemmatimonadota bacterium]
MSRRAVAGVIIGAWVVALGWLTRREYWRPRGTALAEAGQRVPPGSAFYTLTLAGQQIGYASNTVDTTTEELRLQDVMVVEVPALGQLHRTDVRTDAVLTRSLRLKSFRATLQGETGRFTAAGDVQSDTLLVAELESEGSRQTFRIPMKRPIVLPGLVPLHVALAGGGRLKVGARYTVDVFDPMLLTERAIDIAVTGESTLVVPDSADSDSLATHWFPVRWDTLHAWRVEQRGNRLALEAWIDDLGRVVSASSPMGFRMDRTAYEIAYEN